MHKGQSSRSRGSEQEGEGDEVLKVLGSQIIRRFVHHCKTLAFTLSKWESMECFEPRNSKICFRVSRDRFNCCFENRLQAGRCQNRETGQEAFIVIPEREDSNRYGLNFVSPKFICGRLIALRCDHIGATAFKKLTKVK